jgi:hypothetical protein
MSWLSKPKIVPTPSQGRKKEREEGRILLVKDK